MNYKSSFILRVLKLINMLGNTALYMIFFYITSPKLQDISHHLTPYAIFTVLFFGVFFWLRHVYNAYAVDGERLYLLVYSLTLSSVISSAIIYVVQAAFLHEIPYIPFLLALFLAELIWNFLWGVIANKLYSVLYKAPKTAIVFRDKNDLDKLLELDELSPKSGKFEVVKMIENPEEIHTLIAQLEGCEAIFVAGINATLRNGIAKYCIENHVQAFIEPKVGDIIMMGSRHVRRFSIPIVQIRNAEPNLVYRVIKRFFDILLSLIGIIITSPIMLITAIAIKAYDGGPVFYKQVRLTKNRKKFNVIKFRSMKVDAEKDGVARLATDNDDRITPIGRTIRVLRIDELPQLFCCLLGVMSIVGPRPERPEIAEQYEETMPAFALRLQVKAGLTGYAQVYGRYNTEPYDKLQMDLMYINNMSISHDLGLMFATVKILFMKESTSGIDKGQVTASRESVDSRELVLTDINK